MSEFANIGWAAVIILFFAGIGLLVAARKISGPEWETKKDPLGVPWPQRHFSLVLNGSMLLLISLALALAKLNKV